MYIQEKIFTEELAVWATFVFQSYGEFTKKKKYDTSQGLEIICHWF
jgi:hypothetical protein